MKVQDVKDMMKKSMAKKNVSHTIDLTKIDGDGTFPCPKCGIVISPEDESEVLYKIVDTTVINDELVELVIMCTKCGSNTKLTGFQPSIKGVDSE